jgi:hypothetical protein
MNKHWHYLEREMARRMEVHKRELTEARLEQQRIKQLFKAVLKAVRDFTSYGVKVTADLVSRKISTTFKRVKRSL